MEVPFVPGKKLSLLRLGWEKGSRNQRPNFKAQGFRFAVDRLFILKHRPPIWILLKRRNPQTSFGDFINPVSLAAVFSVGGYSYQRGWLQK